MAAPSEQHVDLSDDQLLRRAVTYTRPCGFEAIEKWRAVATLFGVDRAVAQSLCRRFGVNPDELVAQ